MPTSTISHPEWSHRVIIKCVSDYYPTPWLACVRSLPGGLSLFPPRTLTSRSAESSKEDLRSKDGHTYTKHVSMSEGFQRGSECRIANGKEGVAGGGGGDWNEEGRSETDRAM